jgi:uncharacterized damage-inducible protein DinB
MQTAATILIAHLKEIFDGDPWYGDNIQKKLSSINAAQAAWQPHPGAHSIAQVLKHMINWKKQVIRKLETNDAGHDIQIDSKEDWDSSLTGTTPEEWQELVNEFTTTQQQLLTLLANKTDDDLQQQVSNRTYNMHYLANGIYEHNIYHLGQIGYIQSLWTKTQQPS